MYRTLLLATVLTTFTLGVSVSAISLHDPTGEERTAFERLAVYNRDIVKVSGPYDSWETAVKNLGRAKYIDDLEQYKTIDNLQSQLKPILGGYYVSAYYVDFNILTHDDGMVKIKPTGNDVGETKYIVEYKTQEHYIDSILWNPFVEKVITVADPIISYENQYGTGKLIVVTAFGYQEDVQGFPDKGLIAANKAYKAAEDTLVSRVLELGWVDTSREAELRDYLNTNDGIHKGYTLDAMGFGVMAQKDLFLYIDDKGNFHHRHYSVVSEWEKSYNKNFRLYKYIPLDKKIKSITVVQTN
ncbi:hypothetical protein LJD63_04165 [Veillonella nakazawae]|uniref:Uncharacterized protein n=1 Tax=Veillonella nakazawae TaxID=2682456 RepID=A0AB35H9A0_9FIRM|nr:hypothetical protein [Veillonella nakazawae]MCB8605447.1 hypothetical protein [Veillonella nakazawae]